MQNLSPVKIIAGIAAIVMAAIFLFLATQMRGAVGEMFSIIRLSSPKTSAPAAQANPSGAHASGVRVIPIGVAAPPSAPAAGKASGG